jgi:hypothetical protein
MGYTLIDGRQVRDTTVPMSKLLTDANLDFGGHKITNLGSPNEAGDVVNKGYVDSVAQGLDVKGSCKAATTANINLAAGPLVVDTDVTVVAGNRILVKSQDDKKQNGIYIVGTVGPYDSGTWVRATDADNTPGAEVSSGMFTFVEDGHTLADKGFVLTSPDTTTINSIPCVNLGTDNIIFSQFSGAGQITAGAGLSEAGDIINVNIDNSTIGINLDDELYVKANGITATEINASAVGAGLGGGGGTAIYNTDTGSAAVTGHNLAYDHTKIHDAATAGTGIGVSGQQISNTDTGSAAVTGHNLAYDHTKIHDAATAGTGISVSGQQISVNAATILAVANYIVRDAPTGNYNHINKDYVLANVPVAGTEMVFLNGILQNVGGSNDYTIVPATKTITMIDAPKSGDLILVTYLKVAA